jgi:hypothetical protein
LLASNGCGIVEAYEGGSVKSAFGTSQSCPDNRVTVDRATRPDWLKADPPPPVPPPPPEVAADPERLAVYRQAHAPPPDPHADSTFFEARGCGRSDVYECRLVPNLDGQSVSPRCEQISPKPATTKAPQVPGFGDVTARINAPGVFPLPLRSAPMSVPAQIAGLRVLLADRIVGPEVDPAAKARSACTRDGESLLGQIGWAPVLDGAQPHDLVWRADCTASADFVTGSDGSLYVLLPLDTRSGRFEAPDGRVVDELPAVPLTMRCPVADQATCAESLREYFRGVVVGAVAGSAKLRAYAEHR